MICKQSELIILEVAHPWKGVAIKDSSSTPNLHPHPENDTTTNTTTTTNNNTNNNNNNNNSNNNYYNNTTCKNK